MSPDFMRLYSSHGDALEPRRGRLYHDFTTDADHDAESHSDALIAKTINWGYSSLPRHFLSSVPHAQKASRHGQELSGQQCQSFRSFGAFADAVLQLSSTRRLASVDPSTRHCTHLCLNALRSSSQGISSIVFGTCVSFELLDGTSQVVSRTFRWPSGPFEKLVSRLSAKEICILRPDRQRMTSHIKEEFPLSPRFSLQL